MSFRIYRKRIYLSLFVLITLAVIILPKPSLRSNKTPNKLLQTPVVHTINLTSTGFEPQKITIKKGEVIIWSNKSGKQASVNSAEYPTHARFPELNLGVFDDGQNVQTRIYRTGELRYDNHLNPSQTGVIVVQ